MKIKELEKYKGRMVEIIIFEGEENPEPKAVGVKTVPVNKSLRGALNKYAKTGLQQKEKEAWKTAVGDKFENIRDFCFGRGRKRILNALYALLGTFRYFILDF
ncbi:MAG: hypothetical protein WCJ01_00135 [Ignavibacteria bacterium]